MAVAEQTQPHSSKVYRIIAVLAVIATILGLGVFAFGTVFMRGARGVTVKNAITDLTATPSGDLDHDGLSNADESINHTDFWNPDSDGDGFTDGDEVKSGYNPNGVGKNGASFSAEEILQHL